MSNNRISVAIVGGGIGGLSLALALLKHSHLDVQVYEGAHKFAEIGAGVSFAPNAQRALKLIGPGLEQAYLNQATGNAAKDMKNVFFEYRFGEKGPREGQFIAAPHSETGQSSVHRAKFLDELVALVPKEISNFGKRLQKIDELEDGDITLHFTDGTTATANCVIGADGVHSVTRPYVIGQDHPAVNPQYSKTVAYRGLIPMKDAIESLGSHLAENSALLVGKDRIIMTYPIDFGETMNVVAVNSSDYPTWEGPWIKPTQPGQLAREFEGWGDHAQKIVSLLEKQDTAAWSMWDLKPIPIYCKGRIALMGDAAHATTPYQGQGAGQAIEDAYVIGSLMSLVQSKADLLNMFKAYDKIRRPRSQMICKTSRESLEIQTMQNASFGDDIGLFKETFDWRMDWIWHRDIEGEFREAKIVFDKLQRGEELYY